MKILKYCPNCGKESLQWDGERKWSCQNCGFTLYNNVAGAVAVVIRYNDEIYLTRRNRDPKKGKLDLAGGFVDPKESAEETCKRELFEELQLDVDISNLKYLTSLPNVYQYKEIDYNTIDLFYEYRVPEKFEVNLELSEISEAVWIPLKELNLEDIAFDSQKKFFEEYLKNI
ncbi:MULTISPECIES: NUDIX domain-containing protein [Chryseobacterium]|mgnify:FL=1|jgi:NADH pyrophosphatase NudC (nudix superfamily)|uniref:NUDIX domain-containing protein n=2 Tax=Chryseobacterium TaxID=59732 RepID=A0A1N7QUM3_9FLAO|nr:MULTISPECIES: NUDIX domain-containing protein [Chryseobacterium]MBL7880035.1 NUDIX domain-containing protein [Chryseobacterium gambrini]MCF2220495.1 NUDIX domain-containing protein [Chryseobacterium sp. PS-8]MCQ4142391.1 NUDIX domain-containing protein [Chryseobacterium sp. EO14]PTT71652.1 NUDIX domain-containing protein [Chryseobacterium sp. HMWF001]PVV56847.1 NUDIX domain-containing protein [Chryseobacterium sp. HMWF035]